MAAYTYGQTVESRASSRVRIASLRASVRVPLIATLDNEIHPTIEEDIGETNPGETPNIQIGDEDNINEHGIYFIATSFTPCSYAISSQSIGLSNITTFEISNPLFLSIYKNFKRAIVDAYVHNKYCISR